MDIAMRSEDIRDLLKSKPFRPFRFTLTDGTSYDVRHPELVNVGRATIFLGIPRVEEPEPIRPEDIPDPSNYTICAPQLLHLDLEGKPLWFNGWLLDNKFADKKQKKFGNFQHYLIEPRDIRDPGAWQLEESNMCCLTTDAELKRDFSKAEKEILDMMIGQAKEVGVAP